MLAARGGGLAGFLPRTKLRADDLRPPPTRPGAWFHRNIAIHPCRLLPVLSGSRGCGGGLGGGAPPSATTSPPGETPPSGGSVGWRPAARAGRGRVTMGRVTDTTLVVILMECLLLRKSEITSQKHCFFKANFNDFQHVSPFFIDFSLFLQCFFNAFTRPQNT